MQPSEATLILAKISSFDRRTVGESDALAWAEVLDGKVSLPVALAAVTEHYAESTDWLMPMHLLKIAKEVRRKRIAAAGYPDIPNGLSQLREREWLRAWHQRIVDGDNPTDAQDHADQMLRLPPLARAGAATPNQERVKELLATAGWPKDVR